MGDTPVLKVLPKMEMFSNCKILILGKIFVSADADLSTVDVPLMGGLSTTKDIRLLLVPK